MLKKVLKLSLIFFLFFILSSVIHVLCIGFFHHTWSPLMVIRNYQALETDPDYTSQQYYMPLDSISPNMVLAVMCSEDQKFPYHFGFDFDALQKAQAYNATHKKKIGGSSISQQTAKNIFLWQRRNWVRKGLEAYYTLLIELLWSKQRIIEAYLNIIEMGNGVYGVEAASRTYYDKNAIDLGKRQSAALSAILPNPRVWDPTRPDNNIRKKIRNIMNFMNKKPNLLTDIGLKPVKK